MADDRNDGELIREMSCASTDKTGSCLIYLSVYKSSLVTFLFFMPGYHLRAYRRYDRVNISDPREVQPLHLNRQLKEIVQAVIFTRQQPTLNPIEEPRT